MSQENARYQKEHEPQLLPRIEWVPRECIMLEYIRNAIIVEQINRSSNNPVTILDYHCGDGAVTCYAQASALSARDKNVRTIGYDTVLQVAQGRRYELLKEQNVSPPVFVDNMRDLTHLLTDTEERGERGEEIREGTVDILLLHFTLHHIAETKAELTEEAHKLLQTFKPQIVVCVEYDYSSADLYQFQKNFTETEAGRIEFNNRKEQLIKEGCNPNSVETRTFKELYALHNRFNAEDIAAAFNAPPYRLTRRIERKKEDVPYHQSEEFFKAMLIERQK